MFLFLCTVTDFSVAEKDNGVKFCLLVRLLSGTSFSHFRELWLTWSHGGGITSGMSYTEIASANHLAKKSFGARLGGQSELVAAASRKGPYGGMVTERLADYGQLADWTSRGLAMPPKERKLSTQSRRWHPRVAR